MNYTSSAYNKNYCFLDHISDVPSFSLIEYLLEKFNSCSLEDVCIIGGQHLLETTYRMFHSLFQLGLKSENIFLIGKCYSSNLSVVSRMVEEGIYVSPNSISFECHQSFDQLYEIETRKFYKEIVKKINKINPKKIIILDDGGYILNTADPNDFSCEQIIGIEQTSAGHNALINKTLKFPIINVARSWAKLKFESPIIGQGILMKKI